MALLSGACAPGHGQVTRGDIEFHIARFSSGAAFGAHLAERPITLLFGSRATEDGLHVAVSVGGASPGGSGATTGLFFPDRCSFEIPPQDSDPAPDVETIAGVASFDSCDWNPLERTLILRSGELVSRSEPLRKVYNFVIVLTDDQRWDTLPFMPITSSLAEQGIIFDAAYTTMPICCPFRTSLLAGGVQAHDTNVLTNRWPNGGAERFDDTATIATELYGLGFRTGLFGKYLNGLANISPRLPAGWTEFAANHPASRSPEESWSDFYILEGSRWPGQEQLTRSAESPESGIITHVTQYSPYYYRDRVLSFLERVDGFPFFLYVTPRAPHTPATPAPEDAGLFPGFEYSGRAYGEADLQDKPEWVRRQAERFEAWRRDRGDLPRKMLQSLQAVDRTVGAIFDKIDQIGMRERTIFFFTSDSGFQWLEHSISNKASPYEETLKVPLVAMIPDVEPRRDQHLVAVNLDLPATILDYIGSDARTDGVTLRPHFSGRPHDGREWIFFEHFRLYYHPALRRRDAGRSFLDQYFAGLRVSDETGEWKYIEHYTGERELYDLDTDPFEETSLHLDDRYTDRIEVLSSRLQPMKPLGITTVRLPDGRVGTPYAYQLNALGGTPPYRWRIVDERVPGIRTRRHIGSPLDGLPSGTLLDSETGRIEGAPAEAGVWEFVVEVTDSSTRHRSNGHQTFYEHFVLHVNR